MLGKDKLRANSLAIFFRCEVGFSAGNLNVCNWDISNFRVRTGHSICSKKCTRQNPRWSQSRQTSCIYRSYQDFKMESWWMTVFIVMLFPSTWCSRTSVAKLFRHFSCYHQCHHPAYGIPWNLWSASQVVPFLFVYAYAPGALPTSGWHGLAWQTSQPYK